MSRVVNVKLSEADLLLVIKGLRALFDRDDVRREEAERLEVLFECAIDDAAFDEGVEPERVRDVEGAPV